MKKFFISFLVLLLLSFNMITLMPLAIGNVFKEGFYKPSDFNLPSKAIYNVQNVSSYVLSFDPDFRIAIVGNGDVFFS